MTINGRATLLPRTDLPVVAVEIGTCPFCRPDGSQRILARFPGWTWLVNRFPYQPVHTLLVPEQHVDRMLDLNADQLSDLRNAINWCIQRLTAAAYTWPDGSPMQSWIMLWRERHASERTVANGHAHLHIMPEQNNLLDPICTDAIAWDYHRLIDHHGVG